MNVNECMDRREELARFLELEAAISIDELGALGDGLYAIAGKVALPCLPAGRIGIGKETSGNPILDVPITLEGEEVGFFCLSSKLRDSGIDLSAATDTQKHAILRLASPEDFDTGGPAMMRLDLDCVVLNKNDVERFLRNRHTSAIWGGFVLEADATPLKKRVDSADSLTINVMALAPPRTARHRAALQRATESPIVVDRLLHLYHFLELDYDHEVVERIKRIDPENTRGLEKLLGTGRTELERLHLVSQGFSQFDELERLAGLLKAHRETALAVFYDYGKDHNPLKERTAFEHQFLDAPVISRQTLDDIKKEQGLESNFAKDERSYEEMLVKLACYWTYRIRCCIAHNKLGEYHLRTASDMQFAGEFGEPLMKTLIAHRLRHENRTDAPP